MSGPTLRPYQAQMLDAIAAARAEGATRLLVQASTGVGKTVCFATLPTHPSIRTWLDTFPAHERKMLIIAHRTELIEQAAEKVRQANPRAIVSVEQADQYAHRYSDIVVASIQTLTARKCARLRALLAHYVFRIVVYDECQHASSAGARTALVHLGFLPPADASEDDSLDAPTYEDADTMMAALATWDTVAPRDRLLCGFTATPNRADGVGLGAVFERIVFTYPLKTAIADGYLVPIVAWSVDTDTSLDAVKLQHGDFNQAQLEQAVNNDRRNLIAVQAWREHALGRPTLAFTVGVAHAHALAETFNAAGISARAVSGETPRDERRESLAAYQRGEVMVLTNAQIFTEGVDLPLTSCVLNAKPTKSTMLYTQILGRGLRTFPAKQECVVLDLVDVARRHSLMTAPVLYGLPPGLAPQGVTLDAAEKVLDDLREQKPGFDIAALLASGRLTLAQLQARAAKFDIWSVPSLGAFGSGRALDWVKVGEETFRLQYPWAGGHEILQVSRDLLGHYEVSLTLRPAWRQPPTGTAAVSHVRQRTIAAGIATSDAAAGLAEAFVLQERRSVVKMKATDAPWKQHPASPAQLATLERMRIPIKPGLTKGAASALMDLAMARRAR